MFSQKKAKLAVAMALMGAIAPMSSITQAMSPYTYKNDNNGAFVNLVSTIGYDAEHKETIEPYVINHDGTIVISDLLSSNATEGYVTFSIERKDGKTEYYHIEGNQIRYNPGAAAVIKVNKGDIIRSEKDSIVGPASVSFFGYQEGNHMFHVGMGIQLIHIPQMVL